MQATPLVASAGPGYDERRIPGRRGTHVDRDGGAYYRENFTAAVQSGRPLVAIETWNEIESVMHWIYSDCSVWRRHEACIRPV